MKKLPGLLLSTAAGLIIMTALLITGARFLMTHLDDYRSQIFSVITSTTGLNVQAQRLSGAWQNTGPSFEVHQLEATSDDGNNFRAEQLTLSLDIWRSLWHWRWQFGEITSRQLNIDIKSSSTGNSLTPQELRQLLLSQFRHLSLSESRITLTSPSEQPVELHVPSLKWENTKNYRRAQGRVNLSSQGRAKGEAEIRLDLKGRDAVSSDGQVWMQTKNIDLTPWFSPQATNNFIPDQTSVSATIWLGVKQGEINNGKLQLNQGNAVWGENQRLELDEVSATLRRQAEGWALDIPQTRLRANSELWQGGAISLFWKTARENSQKNNHAEEWRLRTTQLDLHRLDPLIRFFSHFSPQLGENWKILSPTGQVDLLAFDIPVDAPEQTRFKAKWHDVSWNPWKLLPGMQHFRGSVEGTRQGGQLSIDVDQASIPYGEMFRAPLEVAKATGIVTWKDDAQGFLLAGKELAVKVRSAGGKGHFRYQQKPNSAPDLRIDAEMYATNGGDAWRYFPVPLMGNELADYLSSAIKAGQASGATLHFAGNPQQFPFEKNEGLFEIKVPVKKAIFAFQPDWPAIENLDVDLNFVNNGLWMSAPTAMLGAVQATQIKAVISDYFKYRLEITGDISGEGEEVAKYFSRTPLRSTVGEALQQLQVKGKVNSQLSLDIPLTGEQVKASGNVELNDNTIVVKPLNTRLTGLSGRFHYDNGNLDSEQISAKWFGQPVSLSFQTRERQEHYQTDIKIGGQWQAAKISDLPFNLSQKLSGVFPWKGEVAVYLPYQGQANYHVNIRGDLQQVNSRLPNPLDKPAGKPFPVLLQAQGDLAGFTLQGEILQQRFISRWLLNDTLHLERGAWSPLTSTKKIALPEQEGIFLSLPALDGEEWINLLTATGNQSANQQSNAPDTMRLTTGDITLHTPALKLADQTWHDLSVTLNRQASGGSNIQTKGREIAGKIAIPASGPWLINLDYLYYNPIRQEGQSKTATSDNPSMKSATEINFSQWPEGRINCDECWLWGQKFSRVRADLKPQGDSLTLTNGNIEAGDSRLLVKGEWINRPDGQRTSLKGSVSGGNINDTAGWFGVNVPLHNAPFDVEYDLHWRAPPWQPSEKTLTGVLTARLGKGELTTLNSGRTGQLLRLVSFDALLRKLRLDFRDTFDQGFYFDSITATAWINSGIMKTDNLLVDGLEADIAMKGEIDLVQRRIDMEAVVAPELSATVGVATAFVINPVIGAAVFAASKALAPLWNKISLLRYHINGPLDEPEIREVLRKPRK